MAEKRPASTIAGAILKDYTPTATEADTFWIRRVVTDNGAIPLVIIDTSKWVKIFVQPAITGNLVGKDATICYNQDPLSLIPLNTGPSKGNGKYKYQWIQNNNDADWSSPSVATGTSDFTSYDPAALTATTYYKRVVTSGRCIDKSATVTITVLPSITANVTARPDSVICEGQLFNSLGASTPAGGSGSYVYLWQDRTASGTWTSSPNVNTGTTYTPDTSKFAIVEQRYYRRVVFSGPDSVCRSNSSPILMTRYHFIENNTISKDTTICSGSVPPAFTGSIPQKGSGFYTYMWQDSSKAASWTTKGTVISPHAPPALSDTTWYRRIVNSSKCADTSKTLFINVHKPITNNVASLISAAGTDTTICSGAIPDKIKGSVPKGGTDIPGDYAYQWSYSTDNATFTDIATSATGTDYQPVALTVSTWFRRRAISGKCFSESNTIKVTVLPVITNNVISSDQTICYGTTPAQLAGTSLTGGAGGTPTWKWEQSTDGTTWLPATGTSNGQNYSPPSLTDPMKYRRIILSGQYDCCIDTSDILHIGIHPLPTGEIKSVADTTICGGSNVLLKIKLTGASKWKVIYKQNSTEKTVNNIASADTALKDIPVPTSGMSAFNYSLVSVTDKYNCIATSLTGTRKADVYKIPVAEAGPDDEICGPEYTLAAVPSDGTGKWIFPSRVLESAVNDPASKIKIDSSFNDNKDAFIKLKFYWEETNWQCVNKDSVTITFHNRIDNISAGCDTSLYSFDYAMQLNACALELYESGEWSVISGTGDFNPVDESSTDVTNLSKGLNTYKWTVTNGKCQSEAVINVDVFDLMIPEGFSPNNDPENYNNTFEITGLDLRKKPDSTPYQIAELTIVNSAGTQVFTTTNRDDSEWKHWDGKNSKGIDMPEGTYYYMLKIISTGTDLVYKKSGFIILKRY
ncbi:MAG: gliding motility-associated C-terminal domain-containing protein [Bacteroidia bacterium]|nr:gliding motility-associated C-terminal domain-containing protein [Bacteroidia bacterium]